MEKANNMKKYLIFAVNRAVTSEAITKTIKTLVLPKAIILILFLIGMIVLDIVLTMMKAKAKNEKQKEEEIIFLQKIMAAFPIVMLIYVIIMSIIVGLKLAA